MREQERVWKIVIALIDLRLSGEHIEARNLVAKRYSEGLEDIVKVPRLAKGNTSVWAQYTIRLPSGCQRDAFAAALKSQGVPTTVYYQKSMHEQTGYLNYPTVKGGLPVCERLSREVISLPMHAYLGEQTQDFIVAAVRHAVGIQ